MTLSLEESRAHVANDNDRVGPRPRAPGRRARRPWGLDAPAVEVVRILRVQ